MAETLTQDALDMAELQGFRLLMAEWIQREILHDLQEGCVCSCDASSMDLLALYLDQETDEEQHAIERAVQCLGGRSLIAVTNAMADAVDDFPAIDIDGNPSLAERPELIDRMQKSLGGAPALVVVTMTNHIDGNDMRPRGVPYQLALQANYRTTVEVAYEMSSLLAQTQHDMFGVLCMVNGYPASPDTELHQGDTVVLDIALGYQLEHPALVLRHAGPKASCTYDGRHCPRCGGEVVADDHPVADENTVNTVEQGVTCSECDYHFVEDYQLAGYHDAEEDR